MSTVSREYLDISRPKGLPLLVSLNFKWISIALPLPTLCRMICVPDHLLQYSHVIGRYLGNIFGLDAN